MPPTASKRRRSTSRRGDRRGPRARSRVGAADRAAGARGGGIARAAEPRSGRARRDHASPAGSRRARDRTAGEPAHSVVALDARRTRRREGRSVRVRRLVRDRARRRTRHRRRTEPALDRSDHPVRRSGAEARPWRADHVGHVARLGERRGRSRLAHGRSARRCAPSARTAGARAVRLSVRLAEPGARACGARHRAGRYRTAGCRPIANCSCAPRAADSAFSPRSGC